MHVDNKDLGTQDPAGNCNDVAQTYMKIHGSLLQSANTDERRKDLARYMHAACYVRAVGDQQQNTIPWVTSLWDSGALHSSYVTQKELEKHPNATTDDVEVACTLGDTKTVVNITKRARLTVTFRIGEHELTYDDWFLVLPIENGPGIIVGLPAILNHGSTFFLHMIEAGVKAARLANMRPALQHGKHRPRVAPNDHMSKFTAQRRASNQQNKMDSNTATARKVYDNIFDKQLHDAHLDGDESVPIRYMAMSSIKYYYNVKSGEPIINDADFDHAPNAPDLDIAERDFPANFQMHMSYIQSQYSKLELNDDLGTCPDPHLSVDDTEARPLVTEATLLLQPDTIDLQPFFNADPEHLHRPWSQLDDPGPEDRDSESPGLYTHVLYNMEDVAAEKLAYLKALEPLQSLPGEPPPKQHINPDMRSVNGFMQYMKDTAITTFVPHNWDGIRCDPVDFLWKPDMPTVKSTKHRPINPHRFKLVETEFKRLCKYHLTDCRSPITSPITDADKAGPPYVRLCGDYRWINTMILHENAYMSPMLRKSSPSSPSTSTT